MPKVVKVAIWILYLEYTFAIIISFIGQEINFYSDDFTYEIILLLFIPYAIIYLFSLGYNFARNICILIVFLTLASAFFRLVFAGFHFMVGVVFFATTFYPISPLLQKHP